MSFLERIDEGIRRSSVWRSIFRQPYPNDERSRAISMRFSRDWTVAAGILDSDDHVHSVSNSSIASTSINLRFSFR